MNQGDLVHIPQGVELWCETAKGMRLRRTERPTVGVYLNSMSPNIYQVYANGHDGVGQQRQNRRITAERLRAGSPLGAGR